MRYLSVCSGIEAATVAWHPLGWTPAAFSEIEAFPRAVLAHHYPDVPCHGDFTTIGADEYGPIDLLVGGTPCQSFSVAGLRGGMDDERGQLALQFLKLLDRTRARWVVWENVPGVLSSNGGRDFGSFLGGLVELGYGFAYRVLDAQYLGVAQKRRRVFVVGYSGDWRTPAAILFERHSLSGHPAPRRKAWESVAKCLTRGANQRYDFETEDFIGGWDYENNAHGPDEPTGPLLKGSPTGGGRPLPAIAYALQGGGRTSQGSQGSGWKEDCSFTLNCMDEHAVAFMENQQAQVWEADCVQALNKGGGKPGQGYPAIRLGAVVRRLTPRECERLQGFPDDYTLVPYRGKPAADGPRYKALGNSMAVPVMRWIGERIQMVEQLCTERIAA